MDPITSNMFMGASGKKLEIGQSYQGGYFAGYISYTANGVPTHGLIVAPAATGYNGKVTMQWKTTATDTPGTSSPYDGAANTASMANVNHPAANYCANLSISGYTDWYLPAQYELEIAYYNLKPTTQNNVVSSGSNLYAVPQRTSFYTAGNPSQTTVVDFQVGNTEAFIDNYHWSSTQTGDVQKAWLLPFSVGAMSLGSKTGYWYVRAFRRFAL
jgi:hypothetical protein